MFGSLRAKARREVRRHISANPALRSFQRGVFGRTLDFIFKDRGPIWFIGLYLVAVAVIVSANFFLHVQFPGLPGDSFPDAKNMGLTTNEIDRVFLAVQATLIGVVFPIAIALVALLLQQRGQTFSSPRIDIYYRESRAFEIAGSSIMLIIVLVAQQFWPKAELLRAYFRTPGTISALAVVHGFWLALNVWAIWRFLVISFTFISPSGQQKILRRFVARESVPCDLENRLTRYFAERGFSNLIPGKENGNPSVYLGGIGSDNGAGEVEIYQDGTYILHDIRLGLIKIIIKRWNKRINKYLDKNNKNYRTPILLFPININNLSFGSIYLCRRIGDYALTDFEKKVIKHCFVFRKVEE